MNKRILIALPNDTLGGAEQFLFELTLYLQKQGYLLDVLLLKAPETNSWLEIQSESINIVHFPAHKEWNGVIHILKWTFHNKKKYDYIITSHVHLTGFLGLLRQVKILKANKHIARESTIIFSRFNGRKLFIFKLLYLFGYRRIDLLVAQTSKMKDKLIENMRFLDKLNFHVVPNPINIPKIKNLADEEIGSIYNDKNYIVSAGRLIPEKGFDILILAFSAIIKKFPEYKLIILGEGKEREKLQQLVVENGLKGKVILLGHVLNPMPYFKKAQLCVVSSRIEGFPNTLLQMMALNNKVVSTLCAGGIEDIPEIRVSEVDDFNALSKKIVESLESTCGDRKIMDEFLSKRSYENFWLTSNALLK